MSFNVFIRGDSDSDLIKSLYDEMIESGKEPPEELVKALDKTKLVQVQRTVQGKNGTFNRMQWVRPGDVKSTDVVVGGNQGAVTDKTKEHADKKFSSRQAMVNVLKEHGRDGAMKMAESQGVTWKKSDHEGINWMRASMAIQNAMNSGNFKVDGVEISEDASKSKEKTPETKEPEQTQNTSDTKQNAASKQTDAQDTGDAQDPGDTASESGVSLGDFLSETEGEMPENPMEAYHLVEAADSDYGGLKVGNSTYTIGEDAEIYKKSGYTKTKISADELFKELNAFSNKDTNTGGATMEDILSDTDSEAPENPMEAYHLVEAADSDYGGLKVGNDLYTIGDGAKIYKTSGYSRTEVSAEELFNTLTKSSDKSKDSSEPAGATMEDILNDTESEAPENPMEAYHLVEAADSDYGGLKVGEDLYVLGDDSEIYRKSGDKKTKVTADELFDILTGKTSDSGSSDSKDTAHNPEHDELRFMKGTMEVHNVQEAVKKAKYSDGSGKFDTKEANEYFKKYADDNGITQNGGKLEVTDDGVLIGTTKDGKKKKFFKLGKPGERNSIISDSALDIFLTSRGRAVSKPELDDLSKQLYGKKYLAARTAMDNGKLKRVQ